MQLWIVCGRTGTWVEASLRAKTCAARLVGVNNFTSHSIASRKATTWATQWVLPVPAYPRSSPYESRSTCMLKTRRQRSF